jgi:hypothetical protein
VTLADVIRELANRIQYELLEAQQYLESTKAIWRLVQELAAQGQTAEFPLLQLNMTVSATDMARRAEGYVTGYLAESVFQHFVSLFEDFLFELLRIWLSAYPAGIPNKDKKPVDLATIIDAPDKQAILDLVIERELNALKYERPSAWFKYLNDRVKLGCPTDEQIERLAEIKASRDVLIHNRGTVNEERPAGLPAVGGDDRQGVMSDSWGLAIGIMLVATHCPPILAPVLTCQLLLNSRDGVTPGDPKAQMVVAGMWGVTVTHRGPEVLRPVAPAPTPPHPAAGPIVSRWVVVIVTIPAPLPDVPVHVEQPKGIWMLSAHGPGLCF